MPRKIEFVEGVGEVILVKRRGSKNIRLSITAAGKVRVSLPYWAPYTIGTRFAKSRAGWIERHLQGHVAKPIEDGDKIGKSHRLKYVRTSEARVYARVTETSVIVRSNLPLEVSIVQKKAQAAAERALMAQSKDLLPLRLAELANLHGYDYGKVNVRKLTSRWGSCSSRKDIVLSLYLIQLPWHLIDYVLLHELVHTRHMNHSRDFWSELVSLLPDAKNLRKEMNSHKPCLKPS